MTRKKMIIVSIISVIGLLIVIEVVALLMLYRNISRYRDYWQRTAKETGNFTYVALGDSAAQGLGASEPRKGYVGLISDRVHGQSGKTVRIVNLSKSGAKIQDVITDQLPLLKNFKPDLVTVEIGANDIATFNDTQFKSDFQKLVTLLPKGTYVANMPYFGSRPSKRLYAYKATDIINEIVSKNNGLHLVDLQTITQNRNSIFGYAADYFHPNDRSYKNWADAFWHEIEPSFERSSTK